MAKKGAFKGSKLLIFIIVLASILVLSNLVKRVRVLRSEASIPGNIGMVTADVSEEGDLKKVSLSFHTGQDENASEVISYLGFRLEILSESISGFELVDAEGAELEGVMVTNEFTDADIWNTPVNKIVFGNDKVIIDFAMVNLTKDGFKSNELKHFADFYLKKGISLEVAVNVNGDYSYMYTKDRPVVNIWEPPGTLVIIR